MSYTLSVLSPDTKPIQFELADGRYRLGSRKDCELFVDHPEVEDSGGVVGLVEIRGEAVFFRNTNRFPIYVGNFELPAGEQTEWQPGLTILLTTSISLEIINQRSRRVESEVENLAKRKRQTTQASVIGLCVLLGVVLLMTESPSGPENRELNFTFHQLVEELARYPDDEFARIRDYLTAARVADNRWGRADARKAIRAYQLLLDEPRIREAKTDQDTPEARTKLFALTRIDALSVLLNQR